MNKYKNKEFNILNAKMKKLIIFYDKKISKNKIIKKKYKGKDLKKYL